MNAHTNITKAINTLPRVAREIMNAKSGNRFLEMAAQTYLDNLSDGADEPDELLELLAEEIAEDEHQAACFAYERRNGGSFPHDFEDWYDERKGHYLSAVRSTYGMGVVL